MRIASRISLADRDNLTLRQLFFLECWGSLSHREDRPDIDLIFVMSGCESKPLIF